MKKIFFTLLFIMAFMAGFSQLYNSGGQISVQLGATLYVQGAFTTDNNGTIDIDGTMDLMGDFINNNTTTSPVEGTSTGMLKFSGSAAQEIKGSLGTTFYSDVEIANTSGSGVSVTTADQEITGNLTMTSGLLSLGNYNMEVGGDITGAGSSSFIVTDGSGRLIRNVPLSGSKQFPVGYGTAAASYAPVTVANPDAADDFAVQVKDDLLDNCETGSPITTDVVTMRWNVEPLGSATEADLTLAWDATQEGTGFDNTEVSVIHCDAGVYTAVGGSGDGSSYSITGTDIADFGWFGVGDDFYLFLTLNIDVWLSGPYNGTNMNTSLTPELTDPYGLGTTVGSIPANTVDWLKIEFRNKTDRSSITASKAFFLDNNGQLRGLDGTLGAKITGVPKDSYYIAVKHRNHLGIVSNATVDLTGSVGSYNFKTAQSQAWQKTGISNAAMKQLGTSIFGMWNGDANSDGLIDFLGASTDRESIVNFLGPTTLGIPVINGYSNNDVNMDGTIDWLGAGTDREALVNVLGASTLGIPKEKHLP